MDTSQEIYKMRETIRQIVRNLGIMEKNESSCCGTTLNQCHTIVEIGRVKEISLIDLSEKIGLDKSTMSRNVDILVNQGVVKRELHPQDRRYVTITLTQKGEEIFNKIEESMGLFYKNIYEAIPEKKRHQVLESLELLLFALKNNKCC